MKREEKKQETFNRIVNVALDLFSEKGYEATSVSEIAEAAGIGKGTFFYYFPSKDNLLLRLQESLFFNEINSPNDKAGPYTPRILALVKKMGDSMSENQALVRATLQKFLSTASLELSSHTIISNVESMIPMFEKGQKTGEFTSTIPSDVMARTAIQIYLGVLMSWSTAAHADSLGEQLLLSFQVFLEGILKK